MEELYVDFSEIELLLSQIIEQNAKSQEIFNAISMFQLDLIKLVQSSKFIIGLLSAIVLLLILILLSIYLSNIR